MGNPWNYFEIKVKEIYWHIDSGMKMQKATFKNLELLEKAEGGKEELGGLF